METIAPLWKNDDELFKIAKEELFVALVGDILDTLGLPASIFASQY